MAMYRALVSTCLALALTRVHFADAQLVTGCVAVESEDGQNGQLINGFNCDFFDDIVCGFNDVSLIFFNAQAQPNVTNITLTSVAPQLAATIADDVAGSLWATSDPGFNTPYEDAGRDLSMNWVRLADFTAGVADSDTEFEITIPGGAMIDINRGFALMADADIFYVQNGSLPCGIIDPCALGLTDPIDDPNGVLQVFVSERTEPNRLLGTVCFEGIPAEVAPTATFAPTPMSTEAPATAMPTPVTTVGPTSMPTADPNAPAPAPTSVPTLAPTPDSTAAPSFAPTQEPDGCLPTFPGASFNNEPGVYIDVFSTRTDGEPVFLTNLIVQMFAGSRDGESEQVRVFTTRDGGSFRTNQENATHEGRELWERVIDVFRTFSDDEFVDLDLDIDVALHTNGEPRGFYIFREWNHGYFHMNMETAYVDVINENSDIGIASGWSSNGILGTHNVLSETNPEYFSGYACYRVGALAPAPGPTPAPNATVTEPPAPGPVTRPPTPSSTVPSTEGTAAPTPRPTGGRSTGDGANAGEEGADDDSGMSPGAVVGIVIAVIIGLFLIVGGIYYYQRRQKEQRAPQGSGTSPSGVEFAEVDE